MRILWTIFLSNMDAAREGKTIGDLGYHRRLLDYQSPFFQLKFPLDHRIAGIITFLWIIKVQTFI